MSTVVTSPTSADGSARASQGLPWGLWVRQALAILRLETRKIFFGRRAIPVYLLALAPVLLMLVFTGQRGFDASNGGRVLEHFAPIFLHFILMAVVYFGCVVVFMNLFRGDIIDRSLHFYFLTPVRREVLVAGKFLAGLLTAGLLFSASTAVTLLILFSNIAGGLGQAMATTGGAFFAYLGVVLLGCLGYGAVFLVFGLFFRNPVLPALMVYGWEMFDFLLPPLLQRVSIVYYLKNLCPVPVAEGPLAMIADPPPVWMSLGGLLLVVVGLLAVAAWGIRRMEIRYAED
jgi:ABC-type transport system involved in multi-copper enzyme maturation permease subunit